MKPLWKTIHHLIAHPLLLVSEDATWFHEWTGVKAFPADAACVVVTKGDLVLSVARRGTLSSWGLPGGSVEPGERARATAARELTEETGLTTDPSAMRLVYRGMCGDSLVATYAADHVSGEPTRGDAGPVAWTTWDELLTGPFAGYNRQVRDVLQIL